MICKNSHFKVIDNSGARLVKSVGVVQKQIKVGPASSVIVSIKKYRPGRKVKKGEVYRAVVVNCKHSPKRPLGYKVWFTRNTIVLVKKGDPLPLANRVNGIVYSELRFGGYSKIASLAKGLI